MLYSGTQSQTYLNIRKTIFSIKVDSSEHIGLCKVLIYLEGLMGTDGNFSREPIGRSRVLIATSLRNITDAYCKSTRGSLMSYIVIENKTLNFFINKLHYC